MITHEAAHIGQLRTAGPTPDYYLAPSLRPFPFKSESELIKEGVITNLEPPWGKLDWPGWKLPSVPYPGGIPSLENEVYDIRRSMSKTLWNKASPWNLNYREGSWGRMTPPTKDNLGGVTDIFDAASRIGQSVGVAFAILQIVFFARAIPRESDGFWKFVAILSGIGAGAAAAAGLWKIFR